MEVIASLMQNTTAVIALGLFGMALQFFGFCLLAAISFLSAFIHRIPGGLLSFIGVLIVLAMLVFVQLGTAGNGMEMQYGAAGPVVASAIYTLGGFLCVLGYTRLARHVILALKSRHLPV